MTLEPLSEAKRRVLDHLKLHGPTTVGAIARALGLTTVAVRQHLQSLEAQELVQQRTQPPRGRGRPSVHWSLTRASDPLYPDRHAELTVGLIEAAREAFGDQGLDRLVQIRADRQLADYRRRITADRPLSERLQRLAEQRTREGYMAEVVAQGPDDYLLVEHHCPICDAAQKCLGLCASELRVFRDTLGEDVEVERVRHLLAEDDRCAYRIRPKSPEDSSPSRPQE